MPPKKIEAEAQKTKDALYIFDTLFQIASPAMINVNEISRSTGAKANTIAKRFSLIRQRYAGLNIQTTTVSASNAVASPVPATPGPKKPRVPATPKNSANKANTKAKARGSAASKAPVESATSGSEEHDSVGEDEDTAADAADDEATPAKSPRMRKKRTLSAMAGSSDRVQNPKKLRRVSAPQEMTTSEDELALELLKPTVSAADADHGESPEEAQEGVSVQAESEAGTSADSNADK